MPYQYKVDNADSSVEPPIFCFIRYLGKNSLFLINYNVSLVARNVNFYIVSVTYDTQYEANEKYACGLQYH